jgi:hypothetical protein
MLFKKIDPASVNSVTSALDLFTTPPTSTAISSSNYREYLTLNPINSRPFHFKIHPIVSFIDLSKCYLVTEFRIREKTAAGDLIDIGNADNVATIQLPGSTFIKNLLIIVNGREVFNSNQLYAYKTYLDVELSYPRSVKDSYFSVCGYHTDNTHPSDTGVNNEGFKSRSEMFANSSTVQLITNIDADLFNQDLYLMNNVEIDIEIQPQTDSFMILQRAAVGTPYVAATATAGPIPAVPGVDKNYVLEILDCRLYVKTMELMDGLSLGLLLFYLICLYVM